MLKLDAGVYIRTIFNQALNDSMPQAQCGGRFSLSDPSLSSAAPPSAGLFYKALHRGFFRPDTKCNGIGFSIGIESSVGVPGGRLIALVNDEFNGG
ncbi:hypothetical protein [Microbulbifer hainanensis]|uniref:hypothetical protein n=1 Tax=Microbulbifer hainanensis TaxID=2735675 RepID=UPI0018672762|nr:hypothetical protein [Microbulbifer hainanensis]